LAVEERLCLALVLLVVSGIIAAGITVSWVRLEKRRKRAVKESQRARPWVRRILVLLVLIPLLCLFYAWMIEPYWIEVNRIKLATTKFKEGSKVTILQLSDIHSRGWNRNERKLPAIVNSLAPDIICLTGDYINDIKALQAVRRMAGELKAKYGVFAVRGNWDASLLPDEKDIFKGSPVRMLNGEGLRINAKGNKIYLVGLDIYNDSALKEALLGRQPGDFTILLYHYPDLIEDVKDMDIDLYLAGHTHAGQIALPFYGAIITSSKYGKRYEKGLHKLGETILYVNRGIGTVGLPLRFFARPEVTVLEIIGKGS